MIPEGDVLDARPEDQRRAALAIHALARKDQRWVLERLAPAQRQLVSGLLGELRALRIPADPALLPALRAPSARAEAQPAPEALAGWLTGEQPFVVAACLLDLARDRQDQVLARLAPAQAEAARALMAGGLAKAHALRQAVRTALQARRVQAGAAPARPGGWRARLQALWSRA
jgi:hypothetical protein